MKSSICKRSIAVLLCVLMLCSVWVFTVPEASASRADYSYTFELITENNADCNDHDHPVLEIYGKPANGTGGEELIYQSELDFSYIQEKKTFTCSDTTSKFPTRVYLSIDFDGGGWRKWEGKFKISVNGTYILNDTSNRELSGANLFSHEKKSMSVNVDTANYPRVQSCVFTKRPPTSINIPRAGEAPQQFTIASELTDQYGTIWYESPSIYLDEYAEGVSIADGVLSVNSSANSPDGSDATIKINTTYSSFTDSAVVTLKNASYTYEFQDEAGNTISSGTLKSGQSIPQPDALTKESDNSNHYIFTGWTPADTRLKKDTVFKPVFRTETHKFLTYTSDRNATCTKDGTKTSVCTCGVKKTVPDEGSVLGHSYTYAVTKEATCTEKGIITYTCIRGDHSYTVETDATGHNYSKEVVAPGCETQGYDLYTCSTCGGTYETNYTPAKGHAWDSGNTKTPATCTTAGEKVYTCSRCPETRSEPIAALGHNFKTWTIDVAANCEESGSRHSTCSRCKEVITQSIPAFGHSFTEWEESKAATCEIPGQLSRSCMICAKEETHDTEALGHNMVEKVKNPDDGSAGMIYYECARGCGKYASCHIEADGTKSVGEACEFEALSGETEAIPTTSFNTYNRVESNFNYVNRGGSLRIDENAPADKQAMRFCSSMLVPENVEIIDFGYIYTREDHFKSLKKFVLGGDNVASTSILNGKYTTFQTDKGEVRTFNIVINVDMENWGYEYIARPYIVYRFAGQTFTVYDGMYASRSVNYLADRVYNSPTEAAFVKEYVWNKILNR